MSEADRKVCMVEDMDNLSPLAEAYARARGKCQKTCLVCLLKLQFDWNITDALGIPSQTQSTQILVVTEIVLLILT